MNTGVLRNYSLRWRLSWLFAAQSFLGLGALSLLIYVAALWSLSGKADAELTRKRELVRHLVAEASTSGDVATMRHKLDEFLLGHQDLQVTLIGIDGQVIYKSPGKVSAGVPQRAISFELPRLLGVDEIARVRIILNQSQDARLLATLAAMLSGATVLGSVAISLSGFWLVRGALKPLQGLADQVRRLRVDRLGQRLGLERQVEELQPWIEQFNALLVRLDYAYRQMDSFNADVAHELRTPLATIIGQSEVLLGRERPAQEMRETLESNLEEIRRLSGIVNDMLFLARADRGVQAFGTSSAHVRPEVIQVVEFHEAAFAENGLTARICGLARAPFEPGLFRRAVSNLLANAMRYADPGSEVVISLREAEGVAWIEVSNHGPDIPEAVLPNLFDRFFRLEPAREGSSDNHGLGLAIVAAIARMHGGTTVARSAAGVTTIAFSLAADRGGALGQGWDAKRPES